MQQPIVQVEAEEEEETRGEQKVVEMSTSATRRRRTETLFDPRASEMEFQHKP
jgi:hypothetical protein